MKYGNLDFIYAVSPLVRHSGLAQIGDYHRGTPIMGLSFLIFEAWFASSEINSENKTSLFLDAASILSVRYTPRRLSFLKS